MNIDDFTVYRKVVLLSEIQCIGSFPPVSPTGYPENF